MEIKYDPIANAAYLTLSEGKVYRTLDLHQVYELIKDQPIYVDVDEDGMVLGIEFLNPKAFFNLGYLKNNPYPEGD